MRERVEAADAANRKTVVKGRANVEDLLRALIGHGLHRLVDAEPAVRAGANREAVHQARVATRRLRSDLRTLRPVLDREWSDHLREELRWIGGLLGRVRDADVLEERVAGHAPALRPGGHAGVASVIREIDAQRAEDRELLLESLNSARYA